MAKAPWKQSLKLQMLERIQAIPGNVVLRSDIKELGSSRQVSRGLEALTNLGELVKIAYGVYAKAFRSPYLDKPVIKAGFGVACKEALNKLGVEWEPGQAEKDYNAGLSTQVPMRTIVRLKTRTRRHFADGNNKLFIEKNINAK